MKIDEIMAEASVDRKQFGKETVRANQKANIDRSAAFRAQMDAKPEEPEAAAEKPAAAAPATTTPNYGAGGAGIKNIQATPQYKPGLGKQPAATPTGTETPAATPTGTETPAATPTATPVAGAGMPTPPGAGMPGRKGTGPELSNVVGSNFMKGFAQGVGSADLSNAVNAASQSNIDAQKGAEGEPSTAGAEEPAGTPAAAKAGEKELSPGASVPGQTPAPKADQEVTLANPISQPGAAKPDAAKPVAAPAAAKGKTMTKQEILSWISRNDEDNAALQSFKDGITAAEKTAPASGPEAGTNYGKATPGIQNVQATPNKVNYAAPKTAAPTVSYAPKTATATPRQKELSSKQYKKVPL